MKISSWPMMKATSHNAAPAQRSRWSRRRTLITAAGALLLLYAGLLFALRGNAQAAEPSASPAQESSTPTPATGTDEAPQENGAVSPTFLAEFDRLAGNEEEGASEPFVAEERSTSGLVSTLLFSLMLIVASIYGGVWLYRRYAKPTSANGLLLGGRLLSVQESQSIGPNQKLHLVRMGNELLLIGATEQNISFLARYDGDVTSDSFADHLQSAITPESEQSGSGLDLSDGLRRLRGVNRSGMRGSSND